MQIPASGRLDTESPDDHAQQAKLTIESVGSTGNSRTGDLGNPRRPLVAQGQNRGPAVT